MDKHAYLLVCHNNLEILKRLVSALDDSRNDIYIHVDRKVKQYEKWKQEVITEKATLTFTKRINVNWGGFSQVKAELLLLETAVKKDHAYYHLLSGVDMPLKSQNEIYDFFEKNQGKEFISIDEQSKGGDAFKERIAYYRFFQDLIGRNKGLHIAVFEYLERLLLTMQKAFKVNRMFGYSGVIYKGSTWFSITHQMAVFILGKKKEICKMFRFGLCVDELFLQTFAMESPYAKNISKDTLRYIDWSRGSPYTFTSDDFEILMQSQNFFARKFDERQDFEIVERIYGCIKEE